MEEQLPDDKLEDFLKKSFEDYTESPPDDLWGKIEGGLPPVPVARPFALKGWWLVAAAAVVAGIFLTQHFYFEHKIEHLQRELQNNAAERRELDTKEPGRTNADLPQTETPPVATTENNLPQAAADSPATAAGGASSTPAPPGLAPQKTAGPSRAISAGKRGKTNDLTISDNNGEITDREQVAEMPFPAAEITTAATLPNEETGSESVVRPSVPSLLALLGSKVQTGDLAAPSPVDYQLPTEPVRNNRLSTGVRVMPLATWERISEVRPARFPNRPGRPEKFFNNQRQVTGQALALGATLGYAISDRVSLVSGLDYLRTETASSHRVEFMFKDRKPPMGGNPPNNLGFDYNLNTSSGLVEVELRMESTDPSQPVPDNEELVLEVNTRKVTQNLSVPLALKYTIGKGRLHAYLKCGVAVNFLLNEDFGITEVRSLNPGFKVSPAGPGRGAPQNLRTVSLNYLAAAGVEYRLTEAWSLNLEPTFMGSLSSRHSADFIRSTSYLAGASAGLSYSF